MAKRRGSNYAYVRDYAALGSDLDDIQKVIESGYGGVLLNWMDPKFAQAAADLQKAGIRYGVWGDPGDTPLEDYVKRFAEIQKQYNPDVLVPDLEFRFKGYEGSQGWNANAQLAKLWQQYLGNANTIVTVMPNQADFNYEAWMGLGAAFAPQAYGADPVNQAMDPDQIVDTLLKRGVPRELISPIIGPGHTRGYDGAGLWTVDDFLVGGNRAIPRFLGVPAGPSGSQPQTAAIPKAPILPRRASQSDERIRNQGLQWGGQSFRNKQDFSKWLRQRGANYNTWASRHQRAAQALEGS